MELGTLASLGLLGFAILIVVKGVRIVRQGECIVIERLGKFHNVLNSGFNIIWPSEFKKYIPPRSFALHLGNSECRKLNFSSTGF